jgi:uncharacterized SAM-binding protein YcdF (DUF218 family)
VSYSYALSSIVLPPTALVILTLLGLLLLRRRRALGLSLIAGSQVVLLALSMPVVAGALARSLEPPPVATAGLKGAQAIVILAGGSKRGAPEWGGETVNDFTLQRVRYGARLARTSALPVYVTGGVPPGASHAEAALMADVLARDYGITVKWIDSAAETTRGNAQMAAKDLKPLGIERVVLVTTAIHMPRSRHAFEAVGFSVIPAPTDYFGQRPFSADQLLPSAGALRVAHFALREWISMGVYRLLGS